MVIGRRNRILARQAAAKKAEEAVTKPVAKKKPTKKKAPKKDQ